MVKTTVSIDGMMCGMCEAHVSDAFRNHMPVKKVTASHSKGQAVLISDEPLESSAVEKALEGTGYEVTDIRQEPYEKKGLFGFLKH